MAKPKVLLTSEDFIRTAGNVSDNLQSKFLLPAIRETQEIDLQEVIGTTMLRKLCELVENNQINSKEDYLKLLDKIQYFMLYSVMTKICVIANFKIDNLGVYTTNDDNATSITLKDVFSVQDYYNHKADYYKKLLQMHILDNYRKLPEIGENKCYEIHATLYSAASSNMFLGGARGKGRKRYHKCC